MADILFQCADTPVGGLKELYYTVLDEVSSLTPDSSTGEITIAKSKVKTIDFNKKDGATNFTEVTTSQPNGAQSTVPTVTVQLNGFSKATRDTLDKISNPLLRLVLIGQTDDGKYWMLGRKYGMIASQVTSGTGANNADFNGYNVTFTGEEDEMATPCKFS